MNRTDIPHWGLALTRLETPGRVRTFRQVTMEFHISKVARELYEFDDGLFSITGNVILPNFLATRILAKKMNDKRDVVNNPEKAILPGQLNAMGLIDEILHYVAGIYRDEKGANLFTQALGFVTKKLGEKETHKVLARFAEDFPNVDVHKGKLSVDAFLNGSSDGVSHQEMILEEILMLWLANVNPAFGPYAELFDDRELRATTKYQDFIDALGEFFANAPFFGPDNQSLIDMLRAPAIAVPYSLYGQLQYMREKWGMLLGKYLLRLLSSLDFMKEEERLFWKGGFKAEGYDSSLSFGGMDNEPERFSPDKEWMPRVLLVAKSTLVWLDQLTKKYGREIRTLDAIPDEELDILAHRGFNALWFIGLWERSKASKRIKQMCGNPEAEASAYSLFDYDIAWELGGWNALNQLRERAWRRGIRIASDMVPNHTSMDSKWISEHPDWFVQVDQSPFPGYTFGGTDLSQDPNIEVKLEDHYFDRSDAAVVFMHRDKRTNRHRFIYHGNDGTSMPWNDTAQLNYLNPELREAVIQVILHVARNFPIIRFDAAMTLAKKHIQRLWFPLPGSGGDIASRAEHALTKEQFDAAIPEEFWREVVDRVAKEVPDTLLLAEAFWMMEGYFVRTLGMHRVYNSAFMHMFKKEDNEKYRYTIKNTLEFDPDILKRFVNFMNNPDEETAAVQFGTGDKYFGVATMMITMPGTPMFGHGQVEGYREKYGMEYRRAYWDEKEDYGLIQRHEKEIFPLMHRRHIFADVHNFYLYDLWTPHGSVNQNVFAYSNRHGHEQGLVLYNNNFEKAIGWIKVSAGFAVKQPDGKKEIRQKELGDALGLHNEHNKFILLREHNANLWYIRKSQDIINSGMYVELNGYQKQVFLDIHEVTDNDQGHFARLCYELGGAGVEDIDEALKEVFLKPLYNAFNELINYDNLKHMFEIVRGVKVEDAQFWANMEGKISNFVWRAKEFSGGSGDPVQVIQCTMSALKAAFKICDIAELFGDNKTITKAVGYLDTRLRAPSNLPYAFLLHALLGCIGGVVDKDDVIFISRSLMDDWFLDRKARRVLTWLGVNAGEAHHLVHMVKVMMNHRAWHKVKAPVKDLPGVILESILEDREIQNLIGENRYDGTLYYNKEGFDYMIWWVFAFGINGMLKDTMDLSPAAEEIKLLYSILEKWLEASAKSEYKVENLLSALSVAKPKKAEAKPVEKVAPAKPAAKAAPAKAAAKKAPAKKAPPKK